MKQWISQKYQIDVKKIAKRYQISEIVAEVLVKRGLFDWNAMDRYLFPDMEFMHDITQMKDAVKAANILEQKIQEGRRIKIIGDYDVDGVMSTYILYRSIGMMGGNAGYRIPHRVHDGYGIRDYMVTEAYEEGYDTIITCDNGISAISAIEKAKELGLDIIVTDHHEVPQENNIELIPPADAVVDPKQRECKYPFKNLCGAGIVYKLMAYLLERAGITKYEEELLPFAAIATVCDVVPLFDENRILVKHGLNYLNKCSNTGMSALLDALQFKRNISSYDLGYRIGPCINAAGRLRDAKTGVELLTENEQEIARKKACDLVELNEMRKDYTARATQKAIDMIESTDIRKDKVFVVCIEDCHESVAGIVAGRIREKYYRPTLILTSQKDKLKGSARSIPGYHVQKELNKCKNLLTEYGGHAMAAGFSLIQENLKALRKSLNDNCSLSEEDMIEKVIFDKEIALGDINEQVVRQLEWMEPFGEGNRQAVFARRNVEIVSLVLCGKENQIARVKLKDGMRLYDGVDFRCELHLREGICTRYGENAWEALIDGRGRDYAVDILYQPSINQKYGGVQFQIIDCR